MFVYLYQGQKNISYLKLKISIFDFHFTSNLDSMIGEGIRSGWKTEHTFEFKKIVFDKNLKMSVFMWKIGSVGEYGQLPSESKDIVYKSEMIDNNQHLASY